MNSWIIPVSLLFAWLIAVDFILIGHSNKLLKRHQLEESAKFYHVFIFMLIITAVAALVTLMILIPAKFIPWFEAKYK